MEKLFLLMPDLTGTRIDLDSQSNKKLTNAEIVAPVGIEKADLPGLVKDLADLVAADSSEAKAREEGDMQVAAEAAEELRKAVASLNESIAAEAKTREDDDASTAATAAAELKAATKELNDRIDFIVNNGDPAALDSLAEIVQAFTDGDSDLSTALNEVAVNIRKEFADADAAEAKTRAAEDEALGVKLKENVEALNAAIISENMAREEAIDAEAKARVEGDGQVSAKAEKADAAIIEAVGYANRGQVSNGLFAEYSAEVEKAYDEDGNEEFYPINEVNFIAWLDAKATQVSEDEFQRVGEELFASKEESAKADAGIIEAVGYANRGQVSSNLFDEYAAETEQAIEEGGDSPFAPVNEANFQAWLDKKAEESRTDLDKKLSEQIDHTAEMIISDLANFNKESERRDSEISAALDKAKKSLDGAIAAEAKRATEAETALDGRLDILEGDSTVVGSVDHHIAQVIDAAPEALDTLKEISAALGDDADFSGTITNLISDNKTELKGDIAAEAKSRAAADEALEVKLKQNTEALNAAIISENEAREEADTAIAAHAAAELKAAVSKIDESIAQEAKTREDADSQLTDKINDTDGRLTNKINEETARALKAEMALDAKIDAEIQRAEEAETALDGKISDIINNEYGDALDSFSEVEAGVNAGFADLKAMILEIVDYSVERSFGTRVADGTQVLFEGYTTKTPKVFVNGILQEVDVDYTIDSSINAKGKYITNVTFAVAPVAGAKVTVLGVHTNHVDEDRYEAPVVFTPAGS